MRHFFSAVLSIATLAGLAGPTIAGTPVPGVYQSVSTTGGCSGGICKKTFPALPADAYLKVEHFSCVISSDHTRTVINMRVHWGPAGVAESIYQRPEFVARDATRSYWYVRGNVDFVIPPGVTPEVSYYAPGSGSTWPTCDLSGTLVPVAP
jgi:hypothetical protein